MRRTAAIRRFTIALILVAWFFPAAGPAGRSGQAQAAERRAPPAATPGGAGVTGGAIPAGAPAALNELQRLAERERQARDLEPFQAGSRVSTTTLIVILLLVIIILLIL
jgi:hypothetical protein